MISKCLACAAPALVGSAVTAPLLTVADVAVVESAASGIGAAAAVTRAARRFRFDDDRTLTTFACTVSTLSATNWFSDDGLGRALAGATVNAALSAWKDGVYMGGPISARTRLCFAAKDALSTLGAVASSEVSLARRLLLVFLSQVPCTLLNSLAMDSHVFGWGRGSGGGRAGRVLRSFRSGFLVRLLRSALGMALASQINDWLTIRRPAGLFGFPPPRPSRRGRARPRRR